MHMLRHLVRSELRAGGDVSPRHLVEKSVLRTSSPIKSVMAHYPSSCLGRGRCKPLWVDRSLAHLAHYREGCQKSVNAVRPFPDAEVVEYNI